MTLAIGALVTAKRYAVNPATSLRVEDSDGLDVNEVKSGKGVIISVSTAPFTYSYFDYHTSQSVSVTTTGNIYRAFIWISGFNDFVIARYPEAELSVVDTGSMNVSVRHINADALDQDVAELKTAIELSQV